MNKQNVAWLITWIIFWQFETCRYDTELERWFSDYERACVTLAQALGSVPNTSVVAHNFITPVRMDPTPSSDLWYIYIQAGKMPIHIK